MIERIKFGSFAIIGLMIGVLVTLPLFWFGVKHGVKGLRTASAVAFEPVERRQQNMADESLRFEKLLATLGGGKKAKKDFVAVDMLRSRMAGAADFREKVEISQQLEGALLRVEQVAVRESRASKKVSQNPYVVEFVNTWAVMKRNLVAEELHFAGAVVEYNAVLKRWPVPMVMRHKTIKSLLSAFFSEIRHHSGDYLRQGWLWLKWFLHAAWNKALSHPIPEHPLPMPLGGKPGDMLFTPMPEPNYIAQAPLPEEDFPEIQYNRTYPNMADVEAGEEPADIENKYVKPYAAPVPTVQKTVSYK